MSAAVRGWGRIAGLVAGPACWGAYTQAAQIVAFLECDRQRQILTPLGSALIAVSLCSAIVSAVSARSAGAEWFDVVGGRAGRFLAAIGLVFGLLFALVIGSQLAAALIIERCAR